MKTRFVAQAFVGPDGSKALGGPSRKGFREVIVVAAHFPHPDFAPELETYRRTAETKVLKSALRELRQREQVQKAVGSSSVLAPGRWCSWRTRTPGDGCPAS